MSRCDYCNKTGHTSRDCEKEKKDAPKMSKRAGYFFEKYISDNFKCPHCSCELTHLDDNTPSCDIICSNCDNYYEVKSKCLSVKTLPSDIYIKHGEYNHFQKRLSSRKLNMFVVIYGADRRTKNLTIRKVLCIPNELLHNTKIVKIRKRVCKSSELTDLEFNDVPDFYNFLRKPKIIYKKQLLKV